MSNPLIPGDPYMYDVKWIVDTLKEAISLYQPLHDEFESVKTDFDDLKNFVNDYFDNLDLSAEVSAKIEEMRANGYFDSLISEIVTDSGTIESTVTTWLANNVNPVGSAVVVDSSLSVAGAAADAKKTGDVFEEVNDAFTYTDIIHPSFTWTSGYYYQWSNGNSYSLAGSEISDKVNIAEFDKIILDVTGAGDPRGCCFYDENDVFITGTQYPAGTNRLEISVPYNASKVAFTGPINSCFFTRDLDKYMNNIFEIKNELEYTFATGYNKYIIYSNGNEGTLSGSGASDFIDVSDAFMIYLENFYQGVTDIRGLAFYDKNKAYISGVQYTSSDPIRIGVPYGAKYIRVTFLHAQWPKVRLIFLKNADFIKTNLLGNERGNILAAFTNITCIGDSLTYSLVYTGSNTSRQAYKTYPQILGSLTGAAVEALATSGASALQLWNSYNSNIIAKTNQLVIIYAGTNGGLTDTLDTDAPAADQYSTWANTNTGSYAKLIAKAQDMGAKVMLIKLYASSGDIDITNNVIDQMGARFGCAVIDPINLAEIKYHYWPNIQGSNQAHYNDMGYAAFASVLIDRASKLSTVEMRKIIPD